MHSFWRKATGLSLGLVGLSTLAAISTFTLTANNLAGLRGVEIRPFGDFSIDPGERLLLTAEGDYVTYTMPLRGNWKIERGEDLGYFVEKQCDSAKTCTFQADDQGGDVTISVEANGRTNEAVIHISKPKPAEVKVIENPFKDTLPTWAGEPIVDLRERGIIYGYEDGRYGAGDLLTRGQLITIFHRTLIKMNLIAPRNDCAMVYNDVPGGHYSYDAACVFRRNYWTDSLSSLGPDDNVTRGEAASLINRVIGSAMLDTKNLRLGKVIADGPYFTDVPISHMYYGDTAVTKATGIMKGRPDGTFDTESTLNRAEAATIFWRIIKEVQDGGIRGL
ncbi:MAG: S-layer homology domain-containing protein [Candidatus Peribacter sp.]|nr:S-layer homology domain-containing protein [Candidatus Peribacter sp.]MBT4601068.1 S-layer homology domain-containing protein [Candidatus Peribacter sp.]MBT5149570.1 S-layer homology domain-containing protein [Candidatus Peribacter sp.]MBT5637444.1 S-layer homology domain-containing protein [Candidatus Peribacter sp.]MBT5937248.1 S-layer homology domain-containing protein [Candidatus Peribacter sp.]